METCYLICLLVIILIYAICLAHKRRKLIEARALSNIAPGHVLISTPYVGGMMPLSDEAQPGVEDSPQSAPKGSPSQDLLESKEGFRLTAKGKLRALETLKVAKVSETAEISGVKHEVTFQPETDDHLDHTVSHFAIPSKEMVTVRLVQSRLGREVTAREFLAMTDDDFLALRGLGRRKIDHIHTIRAILRSNELRETSQEVSQEVSQESSQGDSVERPHDHLIISQLNLPHTYHALRNLLCDHLGHEITVGELRRIDHRVLRSIPGLGAKKQSLTKEMIAFVDHKDSLVTVEDETVDQGQSRLIYSQREDIELSILEELLISDLNSFLNILDARDHFIMTSRLGYQAEALTLQEVGDTLPEGKLTRERVRQLQARLESDWRAHMRVNPETLWVNIKSNMSVLRAEIFPQLRDQFGAQKDLYEFLEMSCDLSSGALTHIIYPNISPTVLNEYWAENNSPEDLRAVTSYLQDRLGIEESVAENAIVQLNHERVELEGGLISPRGLSKPLAIAHVLLDYPEGLDWRSLHSHINERGICRSQLPEGRLDGGVSAAVDYGWIYQIDRGTYRHTQFLKLSDKEINDTLVQVKRVLREGAEAGRESLNLSIDYYQSTTDQRLDYFTVRHIIRTYGEREGIFFSGKSSTDTISLEREFSLTGQEDALEVLFASSEQPLNKIFVASTIRSQSISHASFYLDKLMAKGVIVRVDESSYQIKTQAFSAVDVPLIMEHAARIIDDEDRIIEVGVIQQRLNKRLDLDYNKYFYLSLIKSFYVEFGHQWHFAYNLVCKREFPFESLADICRKVTHEGESFDEMYQRFTQVCLLDEVRLKIAIRNLARASIE